MTKTVHFIGVTPDQWASAVKVWGTPDFVHLWHDWRSHGDINWDCDTVVFGSRGNLIPCAYSWQDHALN